MALYVTELKIPPNTPKSDPVTTSLELEEPVITKINVLVPPGVWLLAGIQIFYGIHQFLPKPKDTWLVGSGESLTFDVFWDAPGKPYRVIFKGYNEDDTFEHRYIIRISTAPRERAYYWEPVAELVKLLRSYLGLV